ncbi:SIR2 family NAD-dependent protein deacylase [Cellulomonas taurus]|uniref:SIR2 family NAD-dependent protein deacylase n=1 Tax=Cellulomonas taurus TaxID=2729175 RepID=UPI00145F139C|nr:Sir2 family NAD-dependent protein deacetylase [Cellulomonas taurus]
MHQRRPGSHITVLTGAGISTGSGIPDFRGPEGTWTRHPDQAELLEIDRLVNDPAVRRAGWAMWRDHPAWTATPSAAHRALVELERAELLEAVLTQNFDGLHQAAGHDSPVIELHGGLRTTSCLRCGARQATSAVLARLDRNGDPDCLECGGILKPDVVYFGERLPEDALGRAIAAAQDADVFVAIGSTLTVQPVASLTGIAAESGAEVIIVNAEPTPYDHHASRVIRTPIEDAVPDLVAELIERG